MSAIQDKEIAEMMAQNRRGKVAIAAGGVAAVIVMVAVVMYYFGAVAAVAP